jgi:hypothetical protein
MAELEIGILNRQCLDRRIPDIETVRKEVGTWVRERNRESRTVNWQFPTQDARIKLRRLYPLI